MSPTDTFPTPDGPTIEPPFIDEHARLIEASAEEVWRALTAHLAASDKLPVRAYVGFVGADSRRAVGEFPRLGATLPGFAVTAVEPLHALTLSGEHRFSRYTLTFLLERRDAATLLRARSHAAFPGLHGRAYRAAVIGSRAHRVLMRAMLRSVARRARAGSPTVKAQRDHPMW